MTDKVIKVNVDEQEAHQHTRSKPGAHQEHTNTPRTHQHTKSTPGAHQHTSTPWAHQEYTRNSQLNVNENWRLCYYF